MARSNPEFRWPRGEAANTTPPLSYATVIPIQKLKGEVKNRYEIEAKTLEHRNTTDEREATSATGQPKHALEAFGLKCWNSDEAGLTAQVLIEKYLVQRPGADGVPTVLAASSIEEKIEFP